MTTLYSCKSEIDRNGTSWYRITKFDSDMNPQGSYQVGYDICSCPAGVRPSCRHRDMLPKFIARGAINSMWMFDFDRSGWVSMDLEGELKLAEQQALGNGPQIAAEEYGINPFMHDELPKIRAYNEFRSTELKAHEARRALSPSPEPSPSPSPLLRRF